MRGATRRGGGGRGGTFLLLFVLSSLASLQPREDQQIFGLDVSVDEALFYLFVMTGEREGKREWETEGESEREARSLFLKEKSPSLLFSSPLLSLSLSGFLFFLTMECRAAHPLSALRAAAAAFSSSRKPPDPAAASLAVPAAAARTRWTAAEEEDEGGGGGKEFPSLPFVVASSKAA